MIFLDTNVISETMRMLPDQNVKHWISGQKDLLHVSTVVLGEIQFGIAKVAPAQRSPRWSAVLAEWRMQLASCIHPFDEQSAMIYGDLMGRYTRAGRTLAIADGMIAAVALKHNATLATRNIRHFDGLGLQLVDPWAGP